MLSDYKVDLSHFNFADLQDHKGCIVGQVVAFFVCNESIQK